MEQDIIKYINELNSKRNPLVFEREKVDYLGILAKVGLFIAKVIAVVVPIVALVLYFVALHIQGSELFP